MQISTIHSFCAALLKERCFEAGIPIGAKVLEDDENKQRAKKIFDLWLSTINEAELVEMYRVSGASNKEAKRIIFDNFKKLIEVSEYYNIQGTSEEEHNNLRKCYEKEYNYIIKKEIQYCREQIDNFFEIRNRWFKKAQAILGVDDPLKRITKGENKGKNERWDMLDKAQSIYASIKNDEFVEKIGEVIELISKGNPTKTIVYFNDKGSEDKIKNLHSRISNEYRKLRGTKEGKTGIVGTCVFTDEETYYKKKEKSLIILKYSLLARKFYFENVPVKELNNNQLLEKAYELLKDEEVRKYFYNKFRCIYVDEFQDTDPLQESIVWNLTTSAVELSESEKEAADDAMEAKIAEKIPEIVETLVKGKYEIRDGKKGFREICYSDFLVLLKKHDGMGKYVEEFAKKGIKTQVLGEIDLKESEILNNFLRLYKAIAHRYNKEYRTGAVELIKLKLYEGEAKAESELRLSGFDEDKYEAMANKLIDELADTTKGFSAYGKAAYIAEKFDLFFVKKEKYYTDVISGQTKLQQFIENMFTEDKGNTVAFIRKAEKYISELLDRELVLENTGTDVVRLMNYHKAKGL